MAEDLAPLILCLESVNGKDVAVKVEPDDNFENFLKRAKEILGFDIDINCITNNEPVSMTDNIYHYLVKAEQHLEDENAKNMQDTVELDEVHEDMKFIEEKESVGDDVMYMLEDGTQIKWSSVCFEKGIKIIGMDDEDVTGDPPSHKQLHGEQDNPDATVEESSGENLLSYKLVPNKNIDFESQFSKFLGKQKVPRIVAPMRSKIDKVTDSNLVSTREQILDMLKDPPISTEENVRTYKVRSRNIRKSNPLGTDFAKSHNIKPPNKCNSNNDCSSCKKFVAHNRYEIYYCNEKDSTSETEITVKVICEECLDREYMFQTSSSKILQADECVVVKDSLQMIYKKRSIPLMTRGSDAVAVSVVNRSETPTVNKEMETGGKDNSDVSELLVERKPSSKSPSNISRTSSAFKEGSDSGVDSELCLVETLDSTQEQVKDFLVMKRERIKAKGIRSGTGEFKCRLCSKEMQHIALAISHGIHHQNVEKQEFPCILCDKVFTKFSDVSTHMKEDHKAGIYNECKDVNISQDQGTTEIVDKNDADATLTDASNVELDQDSLIKHEPMETDFVDLDDDDVWIVQTGDSISTGEEERLIQALLAENDATDIDPEILEQLKNNLLKAIRGEQPGIKPEAQDLDAHAEFLFDETFECYSCRKQFATPLQLTNHKCRARSTRKPGRPRKNPLPPNAQGSNKPAKAAKLNQPVLKKKRLTKLEERPFVDDEDADPDWRVEEIEDSEHDDEMPPTPPSLEARKELLEKNINSSECEHCGIKFMSKIRLRFHEQFHLAPHIDRDIILYECPRCPADESDLSKDAGASKKRFETEAELFDHLHFGHGKIRLWICPVATCRRSFNKKATFAKHMRTHSGVRRYACDKCGKRFLDKQTLVEHGVTHMKVKPFQCHICLKHMTRRSRLRIHLRAHESELVVNSIYCCRKCKRGFKDVYSAQEHVGLEFCTDGVEKQDTTEDAPNNNVVKEEKPEGDEDAPVTTQNQLQSSEDIQESGIAQQDEPVRLSEENIEDDMIDELSGGDEGAEECKLTMLEALSEKERNVITVVRVDKAFRCEYCEDVFLAEPALNKHRLIHENLKNPFICHICKVAFPTYSRVTTHKTTHGYYRRSRADIKREETMFVSGQPESVDALEVDESSKPPVRRDADFPVVKHFLCNMCDKSYLHWTNLQIHRRMKHSSTSMMHKCKICYKQFPNSWGVAYHRKKYHGVLSITAATTQEDEEALEEDAPGKPFIRFSYSCKDCGKVVRNKSALHKHWRLDHGEVTLRIDTKNGFYTCIKCGKKFGTKAGIEGHIKNKHKDMRNIQVMGSHICPQCGKKYAHASGLYTHIKRIHEQRANHPCSMCELSFFSRYELEAHCRKHNDERPFLCDVCGQAFRTSSVRNEHQRIHSDIRPHKCGTCGMAFRRSGALKNHQLIHTGDKKFFCPRCPKRYRIKSDLKTHMKIKHPGETSQLLVLEISGLNPNPKQILQQLALNNIPLEKVVGMTEVGVPKGIHFPSTIAIGEISGAGPSSLVFDENGAAALVGEGGTQYSAQSVDEEDDEPPPRRGRGISRGPRRPKGFSKVSQSDHSASNRYQYQMHTIDMGDSDNSMSATGSVPTLLHPTEAILLDNGSIMVKQDPETGQIIGGMDADQMVVDEDGHPGIMDEHGNVHLLTEENIMFTEDGHIVLQDTGEAGNVFHLKGGLIIRVDGSGNAILEKSKEYTDMQKVDLGGSETYFIA